MLRIDFVTLFPELVLPAVSHSILGRAAVQGLVRFGAVNPRDFAYDRHRKVDDSPYGGGPGMVLSPEPVELALRYSNAREGKVVLMDAAAPRFNQSDAERLAEESKVTLICGHYEGVDERIRSRLADETFSIGDFVLTGGEIPALAVADAITRLIPGVLGSSDSHEDDSFSADGLLGFPLFTRPAEFLSEAVPDVLQSGDHGHIREWRRRAAIDRTRRFRPDLLPKADLKSGDLDRL